MNPIFLTGRITLNFLGHVTGILALLYNTLEWIIIGPFKGKSVSRVSFSHELVFAGVHSVLIVGFVSLFTGIVIAMQSAYQLKELGAVIYVAPMVAISMARELGPVFTALVVAGRVGSAIAAELGTMKVSEQIEALETLALDPVRFLVAPRFLALIIMVPCLTLISNILGILGGLIVGVFNLQINIYRYLHFSFDFLAWKDVWTGLVKSFVFAIAISMISCYVGLDTRGGAEGVGKSTTLSVVISFIMIIVIDCMLTGVFFFSNM
ncbi:ABC transporter permease [Candidatus Omnitrophus magneticus]|uniref:ABC transporter permease n=1 Tax=Candidatus Omnitrophus magneticus TaxID=1609969 RepID=A0A0F0CQ22_9BACT|nr:ABC transporter permease [Candidatus Omnitrophus magneticus]